MSRPFSVALAAALWVLASPLPAAHARSLTEQVSEAAQGLERAAADGPEARVKTRRTKDGRSVEVVPQDAVMTFGVETKQRLIRELNSDELQGFQSYVAASFPVFQPDEVFTAAATNYVAKVDADRYTKDISAYSEQIKRMAEEDWITQLTVTSEPKDAAFRLVQFSGEEKARTRTNSTISSLFRGIYRYELTKNGYKPVSADIDLVNGKTFKLDCLLFKVDDTEGPLPCALGK